MKFNDAVWGGLCLALGAAVLWHVQSFPEMRGQKYGPAVFPGLIAVGFIACGVLLFLRGVKSGAPAAQIGDWVNHRDAIKRVFALLAALGFYILAVNTIGFLPTAVLCLFALFWSAGVPLARNVVIAIIASLVIHTLFYKFMRVPLPWGVFKNFAW
jgi:putative tricarboxylic transport membrane protein